MILIIIILQYHNENEIKGTYYMQCRIADAIVMLVATSIVISL